jgi:hypothetical protein|eukprot:TRINITY_DN22987_c0_g1_i1.p1 TRINITY_DN22987_c0_g1~~TRINITY_DN22987_c0_g1_i1.p1  ORF type:complete len:103 (-),score=15.67 TRINITY_DN22987_c0_g1_i1:767-1075(-)
MHPGGVVPSLALAMVSYVWWQPAEADQTNHDFVHWSDKERDVFAFSPPVWQSALADWNSRWLVIMWGVFCQLVLEFIRRQIMHSRKQQAHELVVHEADAAGG